VAQNSSLSAAAAPSPDSGFETLAPALDTTVPDSPANINKYDLWAIHDLLLAGYAAPACDTMTTGSTPSSREDFLDSKNEHFKTNFTADSDKSDCAVKAMKASFNFALLLAQVHPVAECRSMIEDILPTKNDVTRDCNPGKKATCKKKQADIIDRIAAATWKCIDKDFTCSSTNYFCTTTDATARGVRSEGEARRAINALRAKGVRANTFVPNEDVASELQACKKVSLDDNSKTIGTKWGRVCSYWSSIHTTALRVDALQDGSQEKKDLKKNFLTNLATMLASGAVMCWS
jgi:hypothetical protein